MPKKFESKNSEFPKRTNILFLDIPNLEAVRYSLKTPFDRNVITQFEHEETMLDYGFYHLGINSDSKINHPIIMSEAPVNPISSRACN